MPHLTACVWCWQLCHTDRPPKSDEDTVCSDKCAQYEQWFRRNYSDQRLGQEMKKRYGKDPNSLGGRRAPNQKPAKPPKEA